jgi:hypothetical protein
MNSFDETFFEFRLTGGGKNTEIIQAEAVLVKGIQPNPFQVPTRVRHFR